MKILIVEDDPVSRRLLESFLTEWGHDVQLAVNGSEAWEILQNPDAPNLVISDWMMPEMDGLELCRRIRAAGKSGYIYFIILTAKEKKEDMVKGLEAGADDLLVKPFSHEELKCRVLIGERILNLEKRILQLASTDSLTGILNRRAFMERLKAELERAARENTPLSIIMADIDHFKRVNDEHGHQTGDRVLQEFSRRLMKLARPYDFLGRYGGEEFIACLPNTNEEQARLIAERLRRGVEEMVVSLPDGTNIPITASFGTASCRAEAVKDDVDRIIKRADDALYKAKREGRNCVRAWQDGES
jgi:two-component system chemotaxis response regulator CheY